MRHSRREYIGASVDIEVRENVEHNLDFNPEFNAAKAIYVDIRREIQVVLYDNLLMYQFDDWVYELTRYINGGQP